MVKNPKCACAVCACRVDETHSSYPLCELCDNEGCRPAEPASTATPRLSAHEQAAIEALDPALTPLCVSFVGMQETPSRSFGLYNIEEAIDDNLVLHSAVSLQTLAAFGYRPVMV